MKRFLITTLVLAVSLLLSAQDKPAGAKGEKKKEAAAGEQKKAEHKGTEHAGMMAKQVPEMARLIKTFAGTWSTEEKHEPNPWMPKGGTAKGTAKFWAGPGGNSLLEDYKSQSSVGAFRGHGVMWYDAKAGGYKGVWCDNTSPGCMVGKSVAKWEGNDLVGEPEEVDVGGQKMALKERYTDITPDSFTSMMDMGPSADKVKRTMTITYTKQGGAGAAKKSAEKPAETKK